MASSSTMRSTPAFSQTADLFELDLPTTELIAELTLRDIAEISYSRKGKARADAPLSDEEIAFQMQRHDLESVIREMNDYRMAKSLNDAIGTDHRFLNALSIVEQAAADDRQAAHALSTGGDLPPASNAQRLLDDPNFLELVGS